MAKVVAKTSALVLTGLLVGPSVFQGGFLVGSTTKVHASSQVILARLGSETGTHVGGGVGSKNMGAFGHVSRAGSVSGAMVGVAGSGFRTNNVASDNLHTFFQYDGLPAYCADIYFASPYGRAMTHGSNMELGGYTAGVLAYGYPSSSPDQLYGMALEYGLAQPGSPAYGVLPEGTLTAHEVGLLRNWKNAKLNSQKAPVSRAASFAATQIAAWRSSHFDRNQFRQGRAIGWPNVTSIQGYQANEYITVLAKILEGRSMHYAKKYGTNLGQNPETVQKKELQHQANEKAQEKADELARAASEARLREAHANGQKKLQEAFNQAVSDKSAEQAKQGSSLATFHMGDSAFSSGTTVTSKVGGKEVNSRDGLDFTQGKHVIKFTVPRAVSVGSKITNAVGSGTRKVGDAYGSTTVDIKAGTPVVEQNISGTAKITFSNLPEGATINGRLANNTHQITVDGKPNEKISIEVPFNAKGGNKIVADVVGDYKFKTTVQIDATRATHTRVDSGHMENFVSKTVKAGEVGVSGAVTSGNLGLYGVAGEGTNFYTRGNNHSFQRMFVTSLNTNNSFTVHNNTAKVADLSHINIHEKGWSDAPLKMSKTLSRDFTGKVNGDASLGLQSVWGNPNMTKVDAQMNLRTKQYDTLGGAVFELYTKGIGDSDFKVYQVNGSTKRFTTGPDGHVDSSSVNLLWGSQYYWKEVQAPRGYENGKGLVLINSALRDQVITIDGDHVFYSPSLSGQLIRNFKSHPTTSVASQIYNPNVQGQERLGYLDIGTNASFVDKMYFSAPLDSDNTITAKLNVYDVSTRETIDTGVVRNVSFKANRTSSGSGLNAYKVNDVQELSNDIAMVSGSVYASFENVNTSGILDNLQASRPGHQLQLIVNENIVSRTPTERLSTQYSSTEPSRAASEIVGAQLPNSPMRPTISTVATAVDSKSGSRKALSEDDGSNTKINDKVMYQALTQGQKYQLEGQLFYKNGQPYTDNNGRNVTTTKTFTATNSGNGSTDIGNMASGSVDVDFDFNGANLRNGDQLVVHEKLSEANNPSNVLAIENDNNNDNQTVGVSKVATIGEDRINIYTGKLKDNLVFDYKKALTGSRETNYEARVGSRTVYDSKYVHDPAFPDDPNKMTTIWTPRTEYYTYYVETGKTYKNWNPKLIIKTRDTGRELYSKDFHAVESGSSDYKLGKYDLDITNGRLDTSSIANRYNKGSEVPVTVEIRAINGFVPRGQTPTGTTMPNAINTSGYAASQKLITENDLTSQARGDNPGGLIKSFNISEPSMTQADSKGMNTFYEQLSVDSLKQFAIKAGYGFAEKFKVDYSGMDQWGSTSSRNPLNSPLPSLFAISSKLLSDIDIDGANNDGRDNTSNLKQYGQNAGASWKETNSTAFGTLQSDYNDVHNYTGTLASEDIYTSPKYSVNTQSKTSGVNHTNFTSKASFDFKNAYLSADNNAFVSYQSRGGSVTAGKQFFMPIWSKFGNYDGYVQYGNNKDRLGQNYYAIDIKRTIDLYAQRYLTRDSSNANSELSLQPVYDNSKVDGFTNRGSDWLGQSTSKAISDSSH